MCNVRPDLIGLVDSVQRLSFFVEAILHIQHFVHKVQLLKSDCMLQHAAMDMADVTYVSGLLVQLGVIICYEKLDFAMNSKAAAAWAARYNAWLLIELTPKGVLVSFLKLLPAIIAAFLQQP